jgi:pyruvate/2-oxoglutarate dehydrogenase complex dihydrolipoamide dehydrogenase (E3) component
MTHAYDAIIIGTGQAGPPLAQDLAAQGQRVAIAEGYRFGGSCVNYGCTPSKTLIASAHAAHLARRGGDFGFDVGHVEIDFGRVSERVIGSIERGSSRLEQRLRDNERITVYSDYARFEGRDGDDYLISVGDARLRAPRVFVNTGTRARLPQIEGFERTPWLTSEGLLRLTELPEHLLILGGNYIGVEMGQAFRRLGGRVTIIEQSDSLMRREDEDIRQIVHEFMQGEGVEILTSAKAVKAEPAADGGVRLFVQRKGEDEPRELTGSHWLIAIGRVPNSDQLNLDAVGIDTDDAGHIIVDEHLQTTAPNVYALGDVNGKGAFTHTSYHDYEIVRDNLLHGRDRTWTERVMTYALYTDPPLGRVGMSEREARESGKNVLMATQPMRGVSRAIEQAETTGLSKLLVDADSGQFLGAAVLGFHGDDVVQIFNFYMATGQPYQPLMEALPIHPTIAEYLPFMLHSLKPLK